MGSPKRIVICGGGAIGAAIAYFISLRERSRSRNGRCSKWQSLVARRRRRLRKLTIQVSEDDLQALAERGYGGPQAATRTADPRLSAVSLVDTVACLDSTG
jgi:hypothetical protein